MRRRHYLPLAPMAMADPNFGAAATTPDVFNLTTEVYIAFGMRITSLANSTAHQWGQWGAIGSFNQSWGHSFHVGGFPRLAVYPSGDNPSLIGPQSTRSYEDVLGALTLPAWVWVAAYAELNIGGGNRRFTYWCSRRGLRGLTLQDQITEAGASTFFNSAAAFQAPGYVGPGADRYVDLEVRERPGGPILLRPDIEHQPVMFGSFVGGTPDNWVGPDGRTWTLGAFGNVGRSPVPRVVALR